eukprot:scaffold2847_cov144-Alexandrium_tamarense.AAC.3
MVTYYRLCTPLLESLAGVTQFSVRYLQRKGMLFSKISGQEGDRRIGPAFDTPPRLLHTTICYAASASSSAATTEAFSGDDKVRRHDVSDTITMLVVSIG